MVFRKLLLLLLLLLLIATWTTSNHPFGCHGWTMVPSFSSLPKHSLSWTRSKTELFMVKQSRKSSPTTSVLKKQQDDAPAGIAGAEFFGGRKEKAEFFDPQAEEEASAGVVVSIEEVLARSQMDGDNETTAIATDTATTVSSNVVDLSILDSSFLPFNRFADRTAFETDRVAVIAQQLQLRINQVLYDDEDETATSSVSSSSSSSTSKTSVAYDPGVEWISPFSAGATTTETNLTPLQALSQALDKGYYRRIDVAITSGKPVNDDNDPKKDKVQVTWEISVVWPTFWEPRVLLLGSSILELSTITNSNKEDMHMVLIQRQVDTTFVRNYKDAVVDQLLPRFWDVYHIGMTPSAEFWPMPQVQGGGGFGLRGFQVLDLPGRWMLEPSVVDVSEKRQDSTANILPSHAFNCVIKTMGPTQQRFVPTTPLEITILPLSLRTNNGTAATNSSALQQLQIQWKVPLSVEFQSQLVWPASMVLSDDDDDDDDDVSDDGNKNDSYDQLECPTCVYKWCPPRRVAVASFASGSKDSRGPQDEAIPQARRSLFEAVTAAAAGSSSAYPWQPVLTEDGRPQFTFFKKAFKGCFTEQGLGMAIYEWRWPNINLIGLELKVQP